MHGYGIEEGYIICVEPLQANWKFALALALGALADVNGEEKLPPSTKATAKGWE